MFSIEGPTKRLTIASISVLLICAFLNDNIVAAVSPVVLDPATTLESWYGHDGFWSALTIRVGTPAQYVNVLPITARSEIWIVQSSTCSSGNTTCATLHGGLYDSSASSSWAQLGAFDAFSSDDTRSSEQNLSLGATYGTEKVLLDDGNSLATQLVAEFSNTSIFETGQLGLNVHDSSINDVDYHPTLVSLYNKGQIPSLSYGFTAGAYYREKRVPCTVVIGGYDQARFTSHNTTFTLNNFQPQLSILSITWSSASSTNTALSDKAIDLLIDSTTPYLWFPTDYCTRFASSLGLIYDSDENLYYYTSTTAHDQNLNSNFTFTVANNQSTSETVSLVIPFAAFDLQRTFDNSSTRSYFPLKRSDDSDVWTLGRAFLQETYLIVDYNRVTFSISQALFDGNTGATQDYVTISDVLTANTTNTTSTAVPTAISPTTSHVSSTTTHKTNIGGIIAGVVIGVLVLLALIGLAIWYTVRQRRKRQAAKIRHLPQSFPNELVDDLNDPDVMSKPVEIAPATPRAELEAEPLGNPVEMDATTQEIKGGNRGEVFVKDEEEKRLEETDILSPLTPKARGFGSEDDEEISNIEEGSTTPTHHV